MFSSIAPWLSNSANIASNSAKSVAALTPVTPEVTLPLSVIASNNPCVPTPESAAAPKVVSTTVELDPLTPVSYTHLTLPTNREV